MTQNFKAKYHDFEKGKNGFMIDIVIFFIIVIFFHQLFKYYSDEIMSIPAISKTAQWLAYIFFEIGLWINKEILGIQIIREARTTMWFSNNEGLEINRGCSGLRQYLQVVVLFLLLRGPLLHKLWFIPFSILIMMFTNIFRIAVLSVVHSWQPVHTEFVHTYVMRPFFYVVMIALWIMWVEKFRKKRIA